VGITFSRISSSYWIDNLGFITEAKLAAIFIKTFSWGFPTGRLFTTHSHVNLVAEVSVAVAVYLRRSFHTIITAPSRGQRSENRLRVLVRHGAEVASGPLCQPLRLGPASVQKVHAPVFIFRNILEIN
jgi:hypothetical protein